MRVLKSRPGVAPLLLGVSVMAFVAVGCQGTAVTPTAAPLAPTTAPAGKVVWNGSYAQNIQPIFNQRCVSCHGPSRVENDLRLDSYDGVMKGTQHGPVVVPGQPNQSALVSVVKGTADPSIQMPHGGQPIPSQDVQNIILWIQAGAPKD